MNRNTPKGENRAAHARRNLEQMLSAATDAFPTLWAVPGRPDIIDINTTFPLVWAWVGIEPGTAAGLFERVIRRTQRPNGAIPARIENGVPSRAYAYPLFVQTAETIYRVSGDSAFLRRVLPLLEAYVSAMMAHYDPDETLLPQWASAEESPFPADFCPHTAPIELISILLAEMDGFLRLTRIALNEPAHQEELRQEYLKLADSLRSHYQGQREAVFGDVITNSNADQPTHRETPSLRQGFFLLWRDTPLDQRLRCADRLVRWLEHDPIPENIEPFVLFLLLEAIPPHRYASRRARLLTTLRDGLVTQHQDDILLDALTVAVETATRRAIQRYPLWMEFLESHPRTLTALLALALIIVTAISFYRAVSSRHFGLSESAAIQTAEMLSRQQAHAAAIRLLARYREQHPGRPQVELHYANALLRARRAREAEAIYRLLPDHPELDGLGLNHALALFHMGEYERAREAYIRTAQRATETGDTTVELRAQEAVEHLDELLGQKPLFMPSESPPDAQPESL